MGGMQSEIEAASVLIPEGGGTRPRRRGEDTNNSTVMKKYSKLLLGLVAVVSSLCFLVYKYRYDRLYHVMQVLEVFGSPEDGASIPGRSLTLSPGWVGVGGGVWLYSAYCGAPQCNQVSVLGLVEREQNTAVAADLQCSLWFQGSPHPLQGLVSVASDDFRVSTFTCESKYPDRTPYAVAIYKGKAPKHRIPVQMQRQAGSAKSLLNICVLPAGLDEGDTSTIMLENLVFHSLVGVDSLTLYSSGLPGSVVTTAERLMRDTNIEVVANTWSNPVELNNSAVESLLSKDCYYRSKDRFEHYVVVNSRQFLLPRNKKTVRESFVELSESGALNKGPNKLQVKMFCSEYPTEKRAKGMEVPITVLEYTYYNKELSKDTASIVSLVGSESNVPASGLGDILSLQEYKDCDNHGLKETDENSVYDSSALRFFTELVKHYTKYV